MEFISHHIIGGNPDNPDGGYWGTKEEAINAFATQFSNLAQHAKHKFLFVRIGPELVQSGFFDDENVKWRMIGRFSIAVPAGDNT